MENGMVRLTLVLHADEAAVVVKAIELARLDGGPEQAARGAKGDSAEAPAPPSPGPAAGESADSAESSEAPPRPRAPVGGRGGARGAVLPRMDALVRRALAVRDRGCRYPGCSNHFFLHGHHIVHWAHGGSTSLDNLVTLCGTHHRHLHEGGFQVEPDGAGQLAFRDRRGRTLPAAPAAPALDGDAFQIVARSNEHAGVEIDSWTGFPGWDGERIDYVWTVNALY